MSRVPVDTVLARLAIAASLAFTLAACGDDEPSGSATAPGASTPAVAGTTAPTPETPTANGSDDDASTDKDKGSSKGDATKKAAAPIEIPTAAKGEETASENSKKASSKAQSNDDLAASMKRVVDALKKNGFDPGKPIVSGDSNGALQIKETTIVFYKSPRAAAEAAALLSEDLKESPQSVIIGRKANRLFLLSLPTKPTDEQMNTYRKIRKITDDAV